MPGSSARDITPAPSTDEDANDDLGLVLAKKRTTAAYLEDLSTKIMENMTTGDGILEYLSEDFEVVHEVERNTRPTHFQTNSSNLQQHLETMRALKKRWPNWVTKVNDASASLVKGSNTADVWCFSEGVGTPDNQWFIREPGSDQIHTERSISAPAEDDAKHPQTLTAPAERTNIPRTNPKWPGNPCESVAIGEYTLDRQIPKHSGCPCASAAVGAEVFPVNRPPPLAEMHSQMKHRDCANHDLMVCTQDRNKVQHIWWNCVGVVGISERIFPAGEQFCATFHSYHFSDFSLAAFLFIDHPLAGITTLTHIHTLHTSYDQRLRPRQPQIQPRTFYHNRNYITTTTATSPKMTIPEYNAPPLARTFVLIRTLSILVLLAIVGITANFVSQIVASNISPPREIVATLTITSLATLYTLLTLPLFLSPASRSLLTMTVLDALLLLAFIALSVLLGRPLSFLSCYSISSSRSSTASAAAFAQALAADKPLDFGVWAEGSRATCWEVKIIWGLGIAESVLFAGSVVLLPVLWGKQRRGAGKGKGGV
ncbi:unnamed protein product [Zymoseptoria tritici ST99CH_3D1]|nr:unnamed protein product [Zymoseptoria tritici ST99CH_3D1]